ncbi:MAG: 3',5'-cyclic-nucleotide phosphodiesterase [Proteobacteria bacterium]|nr:3',5'-cyclic-nucleotide phosphodiesterase [Pseudomonadota bacterium]
MKIEVLGCYGGVDPKHNPVTLLVNEKYLLDAGTIVKELSLKRQENIESICITHCHLDHIKDLCFLADNMILSGNTKGSIKVFGIDPVLNMLKKYVMNNKIWPDFFEIRGTKGNHILKLVPVEIGEKTKFGGELNIEAVATCHSCDSSGFVINDGKKSIVYTGDTGPCPALWRRLSKIKDLKAVFIEISFPNKMRELAKLTGHLTPELFAEELKALKNSERIDFYIFHIKPQFQKIIKREINKLNMKNVHILNDGDVIEIDG